MPEETSKDETVAGEFKNGLRSNLIAAAATGVAGGIVAALGAAWALVATVPGRVGLIPEGAVVAFDLKDGCPAGWMSYDKGSGRFIIGAASKKELDKIPGPFARDARGADISARIFDTAGGEQQHILTIEEMPSHSHDYETAKYNDGNRSGHQDAGYQKETRKTTPTGENKPHNIMPPYVALWWCRKN